MNQNDVRLSVLLATYNPREDWLRQAIESALSQTVTSFELLICDDSRDSDVGTIASSYSDDRIRTLRGPRRGPGYNHLFAIRKARAPLLSILNHDDAWMPTLAERLLEAYSSAPDVVLAFSDHAVMDERGLVSQSRSDAVSAQWHRTFLSAGRHAPFARLGLIDGAIPLAQAAIFPRHLAIALDPRSDKAYDRYLTYLLARTRSGAVYVPERLAIWRETSSNLTSDRSIGSGIAHLRMTCKFLADPALAELRGELASELARGCRSLMGTGWHTVRSCFKAPRAHNNNPTSRS